MYSPDSGVLNINFFTFKLHGLLAYATALQMQVVCIDAECGFVYSTAIEACRLGMELWLAFVHSRGGMKRKIYKSCLHSKRVLP